MTAAMDIIQELKTHLEIITEANGYAVTVGSVGIGRAALVVAEEIELPAITLTMVQDIVPRDAGTGQESSIEAATWGQKWERLIYLEGIVKGDDWDVQLDKFVDAIRKALVTFPHPLRMGGPQFEPPDVAGEAATLTIRLIIPYAADYSAQF